MTRLILALLTVLCLPSLAKAQNKELALRAGDQLTLQVSGIPPEETTAISHAYRVSEKGTISLLYLKEVNVAGLKPSELESKIAQLYISGEIYTHPTVTVNVDTVGIERIVTVGGAVNKGGPVAYRPGLTVGGALDSAGGPSPFGKLKEVLLIRAGKEYKLDLRRASNPDSGTTLEPGDRIVVPD